MSDSTNYDAHYLAIGRMLVLFQSLEATNKHGLQLLMSSELDKPGGQLVHAAVTEMSFGLTTRIVATIPAIYTTERLGFKNSGAEPRVAEALHDANEQLKQGIKLAAEAEQRRNQLVHSYWFVGPGYVTQPATMTRMKVKVRLGSVSTDVEVESLAAIEENSEKAMQAMSLLGSALRDYRLILSHPW